MTTPTRGELITWASAHTKHASAAAEQLLGLFAQRPTEEHQRATRLIEALRSSSYAAGGLHSDLAEQRHRPGLARTQRPHHNVYQAGCSDAQRPSQGPGFGELEEAGS